MALTAKPSVSALQVGATGYTVYNNAPINGAITRTRTSVVESDTPGTATEVLQYELTGYPNLFFPSVGVKASEAALKTHLDGLVDALN